MVNEACTCSVDRPCTCGWPDVVDPRFVADWIVYGYNSMDGYLAKHAAFAAYLERRP